MRFQEAIASLGRPKTPGEAIAAIRAQRGDQAAAAAQAQIKAAADRFAAAESAIPLNVDQAIAAIRAEHGRGATHWLADRFGITLRQAQRYMKGQGLGTRTIRSRARREQLVAAAAEPAQARAARARGQLGEAQRDVMRQASRRWVAAQLLRRATRVTVGRVKVWDKSQKRPAGSRDVGSHPVGANLRRADLVSCAQYLEAGDEEGALHAMSEALLGAYAVANRDNRYIVSDAVYIYDYPTGINVET